MATHMVSQDPPSIFPTADAVMSRKWKSVLLLAVMYGVAIALKFVLIVVKIPLDIIASFDDTTKWAMLGLGGAVSAFNLAVGLEDYGKWRGPAAVRPSVTEVRSSDER